MSDENNLNLKITDPVYLSYWRSLHSYYYAFLLLVISFFSYTVYNIVETENFEKEFQPADSSSGTIINLSIPDQKRRKIRYDIQKLQVVFGTGICIYLLLFFVYYVYRIYNRHWSYDEFADREKSDNNYMPDETKRILFYGFYGFLLAYSSYFLQQWVTKKGSLNSGDSDVNAFICGLLIAFSFIMIVFTINTPSQEEDEEEEFEKIDRNANKIGNKLEEEENAKIDSYKKSIEEFEKKKNNYDNKLRSMILTPSQTTSIQNKIDNINEKIKNMKEAVEIFEANKIKLKKQLDVDFKNIREKMVWGDSDQIKKEVEDAWGVFDETSFEGNGLQRKEALVNYHNKLLEMLYSMNSDYFEKDKENDKEFFNKIAISTR